MPPAERRLSAKPTRARDSAMVPSVTRIAFGENASAETRSASNCSESCRCSSFCRAVGNTSSTFANSDTPRIGSFRFAIAASRSLHAFSTRAFKPGSAFSSPPSASIDWKRFHASRAS